MSRYLFGLKYIAFIVLGICVTVTSNCQVLKGIVLDKPTGNPVSFAAVYFDGSSVGTNTDKNGYFEIDISGHLSVPLIISALGYYSSTVQYPSQDVSYEIRLTPKIYDLGEVVISTKSTWKEKMQRKKNLELFRQQFLGNTMNAKKCAILNEDEILFKTVSSSDKKNRTNDAKKICPDTLFAFSSKPLIIVNKALGYKITFSLDRFEFSYFPDNSLFRGVDGLSVDGHAFFEQFETHDDKEIGQFERKRKSAYLGSRMHFLRALYDNSIDSTGFRITGFAKNNISEAPIVFDKDSISQTSVVKCLKYCGGGFYIAYYSKRPSSFLSLKGCELLFNRNVILNPDAMSWGGEMADQRIGDLLPNNYEFR
ncbi:MAG TPA: carboxypeptidase-like regulatory domain-containing protein [Bacteroidales bacterium]|nr:carboxypeptidase-like regulatory domain-containing protein [Bacteroidales bacterium]